MAKKSGLKLQARNIFVARVIRSAIIGFFLIYLAMCLGMYGYHAFAGMSWVDSFVNAAMILSGMGPVGTLDSNAAKIFAGFYALFSGLVFILVVGIVFAPLAHRLFKKFKIEDEGGNEGSR